MDRNQSNDGPVRSARTRNGDLYRRALLLVGYAVVLIGIWRAHTSPATGYEGSIYRATPISVWIAVFAAVVIGTTVAATGRSRWLFRGGLALGGFAVSLVISLPLVRGYRFYGLHDALTHLGWTRRVAVGDLSPTELLYPFAHQLSVLVSDFSGNSVAESMGIAVLVFALLYLVFVPLCLRRLFRDRRAILLGTLSGFLLLPVNNIGSHLFFFPFTLALFYSTLVLYLLVRYLTAGGEPTGSTRAVDSALLVLSFPALVVVHPQLSLDILFLFGTITVVQTVSRWRDWFTLDRYPSVALHTVALGGLLLSWAMRFPNFNRAIARARMSASELVSPQSPVGQSVQQRSASLVELGGSAEVLALKLFLVSSVYVVLSAGLVVWAFRRRDDDGRSPDVGLAKFIAFTAIPLGCYVVLNFFGTLSESTFAFRHLSFLMLLVTVLGAVSGYRLLAHWNVSVPTGYSLGSTVAVVMAVLLALSLVTFFPSPYIYKPNQQVSTSQMIGYDSSFETRAAGTSFTGIRTAPRRYRDALASGRGARLAESPTDRVIRTNLTTHFGSPTYLAVTDTDYEREVRLYDGFRYSDAAFERLDRTRNVSLVRSNGEFRLYYLP